jgi:hypothetical protein
MLAVIFMPRQEFGFSTYFMHFSYTHFFPLFLRLVSLLLVVLVVCVVASSSPANLATRTKFCSDQHAPELSKKNIEKPL